MPRQPRRNTGVSLFHLLPIASVIVFPPLLAWLATALRSTGQ
jgi:hypothetical protein